MDDLVRPHIDAETTAGDYECVGRSRDLQQLIGAYWSYGELRERPAELSIDGRFGDEAIAQLDQHVIGFARDWLERHPAMG